MRQLRWERHIQEQGKGGRAQSQFWVYGPPNAAAEWYVERKYATLFGPVQAMLNSAGLSGSYETLRHGLWAECANTATKLANIAAPSNKSPPHFQFF